MRLLLAHNRYQQVGGEDAVFEAERDLLRAHGHEVVTYERNNSEIEPGVVAAAGVAARGVWARDSAAAIEALIRRHQPQVAHFTNTFPLISPSAYAACRRMGIAVVQTVQNYRLICPAAYLFRDGKVCEDCVGKPLAWPGILHACYRGSRAATLTVASIVAAHRALGTWDRRVDLYVAPTEFGRRKLIEGGLPAERIAVKPNFLSSDPGAGPIGGDYVLFVGRLSPEKGLETLLEAWRTLPTVPLKILGTGPLEAWCREELARHHLAHVEVCGFRPIGEVLQMMAGARFLVFPSRWYEGFPVTIVQAMARGLPVIASRLGAMAEIIREGESGSFFEPGSPSALAAEVERLWDNEVEVERMSRGARAQFEREYTASRNHEILMQVYERALGSKGR